MSPRWSCRSPMLMLLAKDVLAFALGYASIANAWRVNLVDVGSDLASDHSSTEADTSVRTHEDRHGGSPSFSEMRQWLEDKAWYGKHTRAVEDGDSLVRVVMTKMGVPEWVDRAMKEYAGCILPTMHNNDFTNAHHALATFVQAAEFYHRESSNVPADRREKAGVLLLIAALGHNAGHPGVSSEFMSDVLWHLENSRRDPVRELLSAPLPPRKTKLTLRTVLPELLKRNLSQHEPMILERYHAQLCWECVSKSEVLKEVASREALDRLLRFTGPQGAQHPDEDPTIRFLGRILHKASMGYLMVQPFEWHLKMVAKVKKEYSKQMIVQQNAAAIMWTQRAPDPDDMAAWIQSVIDQMKQYILTGDFTPEELNSNLEHWASAKKYPDGESAEKVKRMWKSIVAHE